MVMPRLRRARVSCFDDHSSSAATSRGSASTIVTAAPNDAQMLANSTPMTPPPSTTTRFGSSGNVECLVAREDAATDLESGQAPDLRAGREHQRRAGDRAIADVHGAPSAVAAGSVHHLDLVAANQPLQALVQAVDRRVLVGVDTSEVDSVERRPDPEGRRVRDGVGDLGGVHERLGGDASSVQAGAADLVLFDQGDGLAQLRGAEGAGVPAGSTAENQDVRLVGHGKTPSVGHAMGRAARSKWTGFQLSAINVNGSDRI